MEKTISLSFEQAAFFRNVVEGTVKATTEEVLVKKLEFFKAFKPVKDKVMEVQALSSEEQNTYDVKQIMVLSMDSEMIDWLKAFWKTVPSLYKLTNQQTGIVVQEGFVSEVECNLFQEIKMALEDAKLIKEIPNE